MNKLNSTSTILRICFFLLIVFIPYIAKSKERGIKQDSVVHKLISKGGSAGDYQAFADACRLKNGDIIAVFYSGDDHVTYPGEKYPKAGRICMVRTSDEGKTWTIPAVLYDGPNDDRDPHIAQLRDGSLICSFFSLKLTTVNQPRIGLGPSVIKSYDNGNTWDKMPTSVNTSTPNWYCSAQVREMPDGTCVLPIYMEIKGEKAWGGVSRSKDKGKTWEPEVSIGKETKKYLPAETDVVLLKDKTLYAALRGDINTLVNMHFATSKDYGKTWSSAEDIGFQAHSPSFTRLKSGEILMSYRAFRDDKVKKSGYTGLRISNDEGKTWAGPYLIDETWGAYPSVIELKDGSLLAIYYEEGKGSGIRVLKFKKPSVKTGIDPAHPIRVEGIVFK
jgi:sialidase-1